MKLCRLTCLVHAGVVIEDLGVRLAGKGASATVSADSIASSKDLKIHARMVRVEQLFSPVPMPIWPFIKAPVHEAPRPNPAPSREEFDILMRRMDDVGRDAKGILEILSKNQAQAPAQVQVSLNPRDAVSTPVSTAPADPVFIPSRIVPQTTGMRMKMNEEEVEKDDFDSSQEALRKMRGR